MKRLIIPVLTLALAAAAAAAQDNGPANARSAFSVDLVGPATELVTSFGRPAGSQALLEIPIYLDVQHVLADHWVLGIVPSTLQHAYVEGGTGTGQLGSSNNLVVEADWHPFDTGISGFFVGPHLYVFAGSSALVTGSAFSTSYGSTVEIGGGVTVGYQLALPSRLLLTAAAGAGLGVTFNADAYSGFAATRETSFSGIHLTRLELGIGTTF